MDKEKEYFSLVVDRAGAEGVKEAYRRYREKHGQPPKKLLLNPHAAGRKVAEVIEAAEALGLAVERDKSILKWEAWVGG